MLDQNTDETLDRTEYYAVDHDRAMLLAVSSNVLQFETLRQLEVKLDRTALPGTSDAVYQMEVDLRSVERTVAFVYYIRKLQLVQSAAQRVCCHLPVFVAAHGILRTGRQLYMILEAEQGINFVDQSCNAFDFVLNLLRCHEDMGIILCETAHTHQTMQLTGFFMTVYQTKLAHTQRQISVRTGFRCIYQNAAGAVHRLDRIIFAVDYSGVHVIFIMIPVT